MLLTTVMIAPFVNAETSCTGRGSGSCEASDPLAVEGVVVLSCAIPPPGSSPVISIHVVTDSFFTGSVNASFSAGNPGTQDWGTSWKICNFNAGVFEGFGGSGEQGTAVDNMWHGMSGVLRGVGEVDAGLPGDQGAWTVTVEFQEPPE